VLIAGLIEACFPLIAILVNWSVRFHADPGIFPSIFGNYQDQVALLVSILVRVSAPETPFYVNAAFSLYAPYYLTPLLCGLVAFFTAFAAARRMGRARVGVIASLWAVLLYLVSTLIVYLVVMLVTDGSLGSEAWRPLLIIGIYLVVVGLAATLLSLFLSWLGGLIGKLGKRAAISHHA